MPLTPARRAYRAAGHRPLVSAGQPTLPPRSWPVCAPAAPRGRAMADFLRQLFGDDAVDLPWPLHADAAAWLPLPPLPGGLGLDGAARAPFGDESAAWRCLDASHAADCTR